MAIVHPEVIREGGRRKCRKCGMYLAKRDAIGPYPTEFGQAKDLYFDAGKLRHKCSTIKKKG